MLTRCLFPWALHDSLFSALFCLPLVVSGEGGTVGIGYGVKVMPLKGLGGEAGHRRGVGLGPILADLTNYAYIPSDLSRSAQYVHSMYVAVFAQTYRVYGRSMQTCADLCRSVRICRDRCKVIMMTS